MTMSLSSEKMYTSEILITSAKCINLRLYTHTEMKNKQYQAAKQANYLHKTKPDEHFTHSMAYRKKEKYRLFLHYGGYSDTHLQHNSQKGAFIALMLSKYHRFPNQGTIKNNYDLQRCLVWSKTNYFGPLAMPPCLGKHTEWC